MILIISIKNNDRRYWCEVLILDMRVAAVESKYKYHATIRPKCSALIRILG